MKVKLCHLFSLKISIQGEAFLQCDMHVLFENSKEHFDGFYANIIRMLMKVQVSHDTVEPPKTNVRLKTNASAFLGQRESMGVRLMSSGGKNPDVLKASLPELDIGWMIRN